MTICVSGVVVAVAVAVAVADTIARNKLMVFYCDVERQQPVCKDWKNQQRRIGRLIFTISDDGSLSPPPGRVPLITGSIRIASK